MSFATKSASNPALSPMTKRSISPGSEMLTPSEIEALRREMRDAGAYFKQRFAGPANPS